MVIADTMRLDALSVSQGSKRLTNISELANNSTIYNEAITTSSWTLPAHLSIFTGEYPSQHKIHEGNTEKYIYYPKKVSSIDRKFITNHLKYNGYTTFAISANPFISSDFSFGKYFDIFINSENRWLEGIKESAEINSIREKYQGTESHKVAGEIIRNEGFVKGLETVIKLYEYRRNQRKVADFYNYPVDKGYTFVKRVFETLKLEEPFFVFVNLMEMHEPYIGIDDKEVDPKSIRASYISPWLKKNIRKIYYEQTRKVDETLGSIIYFLKRNQIYDDTLLIFTSDHGQGLFDHNYYTHGNFLYDELVKVPLIIKYERGRGYGNTDSGSRGLISLSSLYNLIIEHSDGNIDQTIKMDESVFSETFGLHAKIKNPPEQYTLKRKAIFKDGRKLTLNERGEVEEFISYNRRDGSEGGADSIKTELINEVEEFAGKDFFENEEEM